MSKKKFGKKQLVKLVVIGLVVGGTVTYTTKVNAGIFDEVWTRVRNTIDSFRDGVQLTDFEPLVAEALGAIAPEQWAEIRRRTGIDVENVILDGIFRQKIDAVAQIKIAQEWAQKTVLSEVALEEMRTKSEQIGDNLEQTIQITQQIQSSNVTQDIMKQRAIQEGLSAQRQALIVQQNEQEKIDRAIGNILSSEILKEISGSNLAKQREATSITNTAIDSSMLLSFPGLANAPRGDNSTNQITSNAASNLSQKYSRY